MSQSRKKLQQEDAYFVHVTANNGDSHMFRGSPTGQSTFLAPSSQHRSWISAPAGGTQKTSGACAGIAQMGSDLSCTFTIEATSTGLGRPTAGNAGVPSYSASNLQQLRQPAVIIR